LCFFSLTLELLPFYRDRVFPAVEDAGFVPVTADDVVSPGDNISAKLDALIDRYMGPNTLTLTSGSGPGTPGRTSLSRAGLIGLALATILLFGSGTVLARAVSL
jgi:hypothetical protein